MHIRPANLQDALAVATVHVRSWQAGYRHLLPQEYLDGLKPEDRAKRYDFANTDPARPKTFVAVQDTTITGFVTLSPAKDADAAGCGELSALYVDPDKWNQGIGAQLIMHAHHQLLSAGYQHAVLWMLAGNDRAERFYRHHGWVTDGSTRSDVVWGVAVEEVRFRTRLEQVTHE
ncbi:MAG TPA: GNAT family N-acetyltransferase [Steroidobacteraceae bacterium]|nr:GNAT family N-acetyltransferase [Steroidobacteraceae bacterium]